MNKFFDCVLMVLCGLSMLTSCFFLINMFAGKGGDLPAIPSLGIFIGCLFSASICWILHKILNYICTKTDNKGNE